MVTLIAGGGEVGSSLFNVLKEAYQYVFVHDLRAPLDPIPQVEVLHICFPFSDSFISSVHEIQAKSGAKWTVIHSTVPVGASRICNAIHSPVVGIHPYLAQSLKTFTKFIAGPRASDLADYFRRAGIKVYLVDRTETTELLKLLCTTFYGLCVEFTKEIKRKTGSYSIPFEAWTVWNDNYNAGYSKLGFPEYQRPTLVPVMGPIGGHCILPNCDLFNSPFADFLKDLNDLKSDSSSESDSTDQL